MSRRIRPLAWAWVLAGALVPAGALVVTGCGAGASSRTVQPAESTVAIEATGCRPRPNEAVGVVVDEGLVATVAHAVAGETDITVTAPDGRTLPASVAAIDTDLDAAVLRVEGLGLAALPRRAYRGDDDNGPVTVVPIEDGRPVTRPADVLRRVTVRTTDIYRRGRHLRPGLELSAETAAGDSGSGVIASDGSLLAVVWATSRETEGRAWALPVEAYDRLLAAARAGRTAPPVRCAR